MVKECRWPSHTWSMALKSRILIVAGIAAVAAGWWLFRPELLFIDRHVHESFPSEERQADGAHAPLVVLQRGEFHTAAHAGKGMATIHELADGSRILRLTDFETSNGPDLRVILVRAESAPDTASVKAAGFTEIAPLKGNKGDQNYELPPDLDLSSPSTICIWCHRFSVNFTSAPLRT